MDGEVQALGAEVEERQREVLTYKALAFYFISWIAFVLKPD